MIFNWNHEQSWSEPAFFSLWMMSDWHMLAIFCCHVYWSHLEKKKKWNLSVSFQHGLASLMHTNTNLCCKCSLTRQKSDSGFKGVFFVFWWRSKCDVLISLQAALLPVFLYLLYNYTRSHLIQAKCCKSSLQKWTLLCLPRNNFC